MHQERDTEQVDGDGVGCGDGVGGVEGWWGVRARRLSGYMAGIVALSCKDAKTGQNSQKAVFPTFSLFLVILALLHII